MAIDTEFPDAEKVLEALELCANPVSISQIETLAGCCNVENIMDYLADNKWVIVSIHSVMTTGGQTKEEKRYQILPREEK
ncbi:MAG: hypothetical protein U0516_03210 [Candidatus Saccharibacteria bacterium]